MTDINLEHIVSEMVEEIKGQVISRGVRVSNEMRNTAVLTLRGGRHGRRYRIPGTKKFYTASAPGEVPAVRTGLFRMSWEPSSRASQSGGGLSVISKIESRQKVGPYLLGDILENGTSRMAPRPHREKIKRKSMVAANRIYNERYLK